VPNALLEITQHFKCFHVAVPPTWLKWGQKESNANNKVSAADAAQDNEFDELDEPHGEPVNLLDEGLLDRLQREAEAAEASQAGSSSGGGNKHRIATPFDDSSRAVADKVRGVCVE
jgi:hypothetical protein